MTDKFDAANTQECAKPTSAYHVEMPCAGSNASIVLSTSEPTVFDFGLADIVGMKIIEGGMLLITFKDGQTLTVENFVEAVESSTFQQITLADGEVIDLGKLYVGLGGSAQDGYEVASLDAIGAIEPSAGDVDMPNVIGKPSAEGETNTYTLAAGQDYILDFTADDVRTAEVNEDGQLVVTFKDGSTTVIENYATFDGGASTPAMTLADGNVIAVTEILTVFGANGNVVETIEVKETVKVQQQPAPAKVQAERGDELAMLNPEDLASIEPAAGDSGPAPVGAIGNTGAGFGSNVQGINVAPVNAVGPIDPTSLSFGLPDVDQRPLGPVPAPANNQTPPTVTFGAGGSGSAEVYEDGSVYVPVTATLTGNANQQLTVTIDGIPSDWTVTTGNGNGAYNPSTGTWTITLPEGENYNGGLTFTPPADSDIDLSGLTVTATSTNTDTGTTLTNDTTGTIIVDAVADKPTIDAGADQTVEGGSVVTLNITNALTDTDGSETLGDVTISGIPNGYTLNAGTKLPNGDWVVPQSGLSGLKLTVPADAYATLNLTVSVTSTETITDIDFDSTNDQATNFDTVVITVNPLQTPPEVTFGAGGSGSAEVYEDGTVMVPITGTLMGNAQYQELTVTVEGIPSDWTVTTGANNGTYNPTTGTWTITLPAGQDYNGGLTFTPPADSDIDLSNLKITSTSKNTVTGVEKSTDTTGVIIVDAVADEVNLTANDVQGLEDNPVAIDIQTSLRDIDGSEEITEVVISGVPNGFSFNHGINLGNGEWRISKDDLPTLELSAPEHYSGTVDLTVTVTNEEKVTDQDFDFTNNERKTSADFKVTFVAVADAPDLDVNNPWLKEDGATIPGYPSKLEINASLKDTDGSERLVIEISNIDPTWTNDLAAKGFTYDALTGKWILELPQGVYSYSDSITLTPPADSDRDMKDIKVEATAIEASNGDRSTAQAIVDFNVDAVADAPTIDANDIAGPAGASYDLNITNALTDTDGSETLGDVTISGIPDGFTLSAGTKLANGDWVVSQAELAGLKLNTPLTYNGSFKLTLSVTSTENPVDSEIDTNDNTATSTVEIDVNLSTIQPPSVDIVTEPGTPGTGGWVYEDGTVFVPIKASLSGLDNSEVLTVTVTGIDPTWGVNIGANNGTYDAATGTWTITLPAGQNYDGGITLTPPADSDVDMLNLQAKATSTNPLTGGSASATDSGNVIVDAVADAPTIDAQNATGAAGTSVALNITNALTDTDGSETLGDVTISGIPNGYTLNAGTKLPNGDWVVPQSDLANLRLNIPASATNTTLNLTASVTSTETVTDTDFDLTNNTATTTDSFTVVVQQLDIDPPLIDMDTTPTGGGRVYEDGSVFLPISATLQGDGIATQQMTITVTGIDSSWGVNVGANNGTYNAATGTWTITLPVGQNYNGGITLTPPADSDVDLTGITATAKAVQTLNGQEASNVDTGDIIVDAVADMPDLDVRNANGLEGAQIDLHIGADLTDTDGSEVLSAIRIEGLPAGFSLNKGTDLGNGVWEVSKADLSGLKLNTPSNFSGSVPLKVSVTSTETITDTDFDLTNNTATNTKTLNVVIADRANPPTLDVDGTHKVYEDGSVFVPIAATLTGAATEILTVTVTGIPADWTITTGANNGTYNAATGTWSITLPAGTNYNGGITFAPPADSDIDLSNLRVSATATAPSTNTTSSVTERIQIVVDAVADAPTIDAGANQTVEAGSSVALNITNALTDTDGSETLGAVTIKGIPNGYTLSAGTKQANGDWVVEQSQLAGLRLNTPANGAGTLNLTVSVTSTESITDTDFDLGNNTATSTDTVSIVVNPVDTPPTVTFGANGSGEAQVYEDGSVFVPITATLTGAASQQLTVTVTGIDPSWTIATGGANGTYNPATGTWTITLPANTNYNGGLTFTPPANSDVDLTGLTVTATSRNTTTNNTKSSSTNGEVIVDAVADAPTLNTDSAVTVGTGTSTNLNISAALTDTDGSETLSKIRIEGVPAGYTLNKGTNLGNGVWELTQGQLNGLKLNAPANQSDRTFTLKVSVTSTEKVTDGEFNYNNNTATTTKNIRVNVENNGPDAHDDEVYFSSCDWVGIGNVMTGYGWRPKPESTQTQAEARDDLGSNGGVIVSHVNGEAMKSGGDGMVVQGTYGKLYIFKDGSYSYVCEATDPTGVTETFSYTLTDKFGNSDTAQLTIMAKTEPTKQSTNPMADYLHGAATYQDGAEGSAILGFDKSETIYGNGGSDLLAGWTGNDKLYGGAGNDVLMGEYGSNQLWGGAGADIFAINRAMVGDIYKYENGKIAKDAYGRDIVLNEDTRYDYNANMYDRIMDFNTGEGDVISLGGIIDFNVGDVLTNYVKAVSHAEGTMIQIRSKDSGNWENAVLVHGQSLTNTDLQNLYNQGNLDVT